MDQPDPERATERPKRFRMLHGRIQSPPKSKAARLEAGTRMRKVQNGETLTMPHSRPMPSIGPRCHELRVPDGDRTWRIVYRIDRMVILVCDVFAKKTRQTPRHVIDSCRQRLARHDEEAHEQADDRAEGARDERTGGR